MSSVWTKNMTTSVAEIDLQHQKLFAHIDALLRAFQEGKGREETEAVIQFLTDYVARHFGTEERYMEKFRYDGRSAHLAQHKMFMRNFERIKERYNLSGVDEKLIDETRIMLNDWLINHIHIADKSLGMYLKQKM